MMDPTGAGRFEETFTRTALLRGGSRKQVADANKLGRAFDLADDIANMPPCRTRIVSKRRMRLERARHRFVWRLALVVWYAKRVITKGS